MLRTLNFTGRKRILRDEAQISLKNDTGGGIIFEAELDFTRLELPLDSQVFIEAFFKTTTERFSWGTVGKNTPPNERQLKRLSQPELASFRVKVVEPNANGFGRLLALADHISPEGLRGVTGRRIPLFRVNLTDGLTDEVWSLDFDESGPILDLNRGILGIKERVKDGPFMGLVFPDVMRKVFHKIRDDGNNDTQEDCDRWEQRWLRFGAKLAGHPYQPQEHDEWINEVIGQWSRQHKIVAKFKESIAGNEGATK